MPSDICSYAFRSHKFLTMTKVKYIWLPINGSADRQTNEHDIYEQLSELRLLSQIINIAVSVIALWFIFSSDH